VLITHDRQLVEEVADRVAWVEDGRIRTFDLGLEQCLRVLAEERAAARASESAERDKAAKKAPPAPPAAKAIESGKVRNPLMFAKLEERIFALEAELKATAAAMMAPENYASVSRMKDLQATEARLQAELAAAYVQWENWQ
jgi:ATPase subunit of ABC transporter with duplicated ATPase domains